MDNPVLLIVDDEQENRTSLESIFKEDYQVHLARDGMEGLKKAQEVSPDLIILDIVMPKMDGFQTCLRLRQQDSTKNIPIIFLTSKNEPETESFGLDLGADDFVLKPFNKEVLKIRVRKRLKGAAGLAEAQNLGDQTQLGEYTVFWDRQEVGTGEDRIPLTTKELGLLKMFVENKGRVLSRDMILERVWSDTYITDRTIDSHVKELRKKIPPMAKLLKTVYGSGYRLDL
ncbi:MAG: response regulator transcription factor [Deltaproteobacteria bacterium]|nr:response regulator transcription factor [Deltaproteobacteria bacterium]